MNTSVASNMSLTDVDYNLLQREFFIVYYPCMHNKYSSGVEMKVFNLISVIYMLFLMIMTKC